MDPRISGNKAQILLSEETHFSQITSGNDNITPQPGHDQGKSKEKMEFCSRFAVCSVRSRKYEGVILVERNSGFRIVHICPSRLL